MRPCDISLKHKENEIAFGNAVVERLVGEVTGLQRGNIDIQAIAAQCVVLKEGIGGDKFRRFVSLTAEQNCFGEFFDQCAVGFGLVEVSDLFIAVNLRSARTVRLCFWLHAVPMFIELSIDHAPDVKGHHGVMSDDMGIGCKIARYNKITVENHAMIGDFHAGFFERRDQGQEAFRARGDHRIVLSVSIGQQRFSRLGIKLGETNVEEFLDGRTIGGNLRVSVAHSLIPSSGCGSVDLTDEAALYHYLCLSEPTLFGRFKLVVRLELIIFHTATGGYPFQLLAHRIRQLADVEIAIHDRAGAYTVRTFSDINGFLPTFRETFAVGARMGFLVELGQFAATWGIRKISFTGSTETGRKIMASCSGNLKRITLELGGNDPAVVLPDVDVKETAKQLFWAAFQNSAQFCVAAKRLYIHADIYDELAEELVAFAKTVKVGDGSQQGTDLGPIQNRMQYEKLKDMFADIKANGQNVLLGGEIEDVPGFFVPVTIVDNPPEDSRLVKEEPFGPVLPLLKFDDIDDVVARANDTEYGLAASVWGKDVKKAKGIAERIEAGTVWINEVHTFSPHVAFGGHKQSGIGIENSLEGLAEYTNSQTIVTRDEMEALA